MQNSILNHGYYKVGQEVFDRKLSALLRATETGITPTWHFHNEIYGKQDWTGPPQETLDSLYQRRAKQLRDKYDYVVLSFSGGSDSWTALQAFKKSGSHLDEILIRWPIKASDSRYKVDANNSHASNILSEWDLTIIPTLNQIQIDMPNTKISVVDWSDELLKCEIDDDDWINALPQDYLNVGAMIKFNIISDAEQSQIDLGRKTCFIVGVDKPQIMINNNKVYCFFLDKLANNSIVKKQVQQGRNYEHFYWSPDLPEITVTQAKHIFINLITLPNMIKLLANKEPYNINKKKIWDKWARTIIYPEYNSLQLFQADKSYTNVLDEVDNWLGVHQELTYVKSWHWGLQNVLNSIDTKYLQKLGDEITGFTGFIDGVYFLGDVPVTNSNT